MSITDLADACDVGDTSVYRFCRTIEMGGYQDFKMKLSLNQGAAGTELTEKESEGDSRELEERLLDNHIQAIRETYMLLNHEQVEKILAMMKSAERIFFFGIGDSLLAAEEARNKFLRITGKVYCIQDPHMQAMAAATMTPKDFIIVISYSGATKDNIQVAKVAREAGARLACISHFQKSPFTAYCDAVLLCGAKTGPLDGGSLSAKMGQLYLIDLLYQKYYEKNYQVSRSNNEKACDAIMDKLF